MNVVRHGMAFRSKLVVVASVLAGSSPSVERRMRRVVGARREGLIVGLPVFRRGGQG
jgi:hypothetical protein